MTSSPPESASDAPGPGEASRAPSREPSPGGPVDLVMTVYFATVERVLAPGFLEQLSDQHQYPFARRVLLINNVENPDEVRRRAQERVVAGKLDEVVMVADELPAALEVTGLDPAEFGRVIHFSDWALVAATRPGSEWVLHWDVDAQLVTPGDWVTPCLRRMAGDPRIAVANPAWDVAAARQESDVIDGAFALGQGFSDQVFLVRRSEFSRPIYRHQHVASLRYPLTSIAPTFEARVDAYLRNENRYRLTYLNSCYRQRSATGEHYPTLRWHERVKRRWQRHLLRRSRPDSDA